MDLNRIAVFAQVVEARSFTAAAAALGVRKSSVSRSVAALEETLGIRLLQRTTRKLSLTDAGAAYYARAREALAGIEEAQRAASSLGAEARGVVRITAPVNLAGDLATVTSAFVSAHPAVRVEVSLTARFVDLVKEGFDLAVRAGPLVDSSLLVRKLGEGEIALFASPAYLERAGRPRRLSDLASHECILYRTGGATAVWRLSGPRGEEEVSVRGRVETDEFAFVLASAREGVGIAFTPTGMVSPLVKSGELERVLPRYALRGSPLHIVWPSRGFEPAAVRLLRDALVEALARTPAQGPRTR